MAIINQKWRKDASENAINAFVRATGAGITATILHKVTASEFTSKSSLNATIGNVAAPIWTLLTLAGDIFLQNPMLKAFCQGSYAFGAVKALSVVAPVVGDYTGLNGVEMKKIMNGVIMNGTQALQQKNNTQEVLQKIAKRAEENAIANANSNDEKTVTDVAESML